jgi:hypothetical protein
VLRKDFWGLSNSVNLFIEKDLGEHAAGRPQLDWAWETRFENLPMKFAHSWSSLAFKFKANPALSAMLPTGKMRTIAAARSFSARSSISIPGRRSNGVAAF